MHAGAWSQTFDFSVQLLDGDGSALHVRVSPAFHSFNERPFNLKIFGANISEDQI